MTTKVLLLIVCTEILRHFLFTLLQTRLLSDFLVDFEGSDLRRFNFQNCHNLKKHYLVSLNWRYLLITDISFLQFLTRSAAARLLLHLIWRRRHVFLGDFLAHNFYEIRRHHVFLGIFLATSRSTIGAAAWPSDPFALLIWRNSSSWRFSWEFFSNRYIDLRSPRRPDPFAIHLMKIFSLVIGSDFGFQFRRLYAGLTHSGLSFTFKLPITWESCI